MFRNAVDIANRGMQHVGGPRIDPEEGFNEISKAAEECGFVYDKLRRAELRRNVWRFAVRRAFLRPIDATTTILEPMLWQSTQVYVPNEVVSDALGQVWINTVPQNLDRQPGEDIAWRLYFGPLTVSLYDSTIAYSPGELVYKTPGDGTFKVFQSLVDANKDDPDTETVWVATTTYKKDDIVTQTAVLYQSLINFNLNNQPSATTAPALWDVAVTYATGNRVRGSNGFMYLSVGNGNLGNDPVLDNGTFWTNTNALAAWNPAPTRGSTSNQWLQLGANLVHPTLDATVVGTSSYRLPSGFLRRAPEDPKAGSFSPLGVPSNLPYNTDDPEGNFIRSRFGGPITLRFVADIQHVPDMDDMFCEGLAARIGFEVCEPVTQSTSKRGFVAGVYEKMMTEARTVNGIETGAVEPPLDDWIACRA